MDGTDPTARRSTGPDSELSARTLLGHGNRLGLVFVVTAVALLGIPRAADLFWQAAVAAVWIGFASVIAVRAAGCLIAPEPERPLSRRPRKWPHYTVIAALKDEAEVVPQLIRRLSRLDYPPNRLHGFLVVEPDDPATLNAILSTRRPNWLRPIVAPPGRPGTKPRALNVALDLALPGLLTVYDAEDEPHPEQLREAALAFAAAPADLACLQAPLRIRILGRTSTWLERQFRLEYAALFDVLLPALTKLGLPIPLGGTSNHFRVDILRQVGGWDPWNVTEDADLGLRLCRFGYRIGMLSRPTRESPPRDLKAWIPQRTRWLKGFMQTIAVHLRDPWSLGWRGLLAMHLTLGAAVASAALQGPVLAGVIAGLLIYGFNASFPAVSASGLVLFLAGWAVAMAALAIGANRARADTRVTDILTAPVYWSLASIAQVHAVWRLIRKPHHWDKTPHPPDLEVTHARRHLLRNHARQPTYGDLSLPSPAPWKSKTSTSTTPTSAPE